MAQDELRSVEKQLYQRMLRNAFIGFLKGAAIAAVIGFGVGILLTGGVTAGLIPAFSIFAPSAGLAAIAAIGAKTALAFATVCGSFGAVAGIQSTRDARRFFGAHEKPDLSSNEVSIQNKLLGVEKVPTTQMSNTNSMPPENPAEGFRARLGAENYTGPTHGR